MAGGHGQGCGRSPGSQAPRPPSGAWGRACVSVLGCLGWPSATPPGKENPTQPACPSLPAGLGVGGKWGQMWQKVWDFGEVPGRFMRVFGAPVSHLWGTLRLPATLALSVSALGCALPPLVAEWSSITHGNKWHVRFLAFINVRPPFSRCLFRAGSSAGPGPGPVSFCAPSSPGPGRAPTAPGEPSAGPGSVSPKDEEGQLGATSGDTGARHQPSHAQLLTQGTAREQQWSWLLCFGRVIMQQRRGTLTQGKEELGLERWQQEPPESAGLSRGGGPGGAPPGQGWAPPTASPV